MSEDMPDTYARKKCRKIWHESGCFRAKKPCQTECKNRCQKECQNKCQIEYENECQIEWAEKMSALMPERMPDRMSEWMPDRMPESNVRKECQNARTDCQKICAIYILFR